MSQAQANKNISPDKQKEVDKQEQQLEIFAELIVDLLITEGEKCLQ